MSLPNFLVIGAMKGGTTSLFRYLDAHPDVYMPPAKELRFFVEERNWGKGLAWYEDQFREAGSARVIGEASPAYTNYPEWSGVPQRISEVLPDVRMIYVIRQPVERMESHYRHETIMGREQLPIDDAVTTDSPYFFRSCYALQLEQYLPLFDLDRILVLTSEQLRKDRPGAMTKVWNFLDLEPIDESDVGQEFHRSEEKGRRTGLSRVAKRVPGYSKLSGLLTEERKASLRSLAYRKVETPDSTLSADRRAVLTEAVRPDVKRLSQMVQVDVSTWGIV